MKLYAVTRGEYSDYRIIALTKSKRKAERLAETFCGSYDKAMVEEYDDGDVDRYLDKNWHNYFIRLNRNTMGVIECEESRYEPRDSRVGEDIHDNYYTTVSTNKGEDVAKKIAFDRIAKYKAEKEGL